LVENMFGTRNILRKSLSQKSRFASTLLVIEQQNGVALASNLHALSAANKLGLPITAFVAAPSSQAESAAKAVAAYPGVAKVLVAKNDSFAHALAEPHADALAEVAKKGGFTHVVTSHGPYGKNVFPRAAALLDVSPISDVTEIDSADTFKRPIYAGKVIAAHAGNAIATVKSADALKLVTVRPTAFAPAAATGGSAAVEDCSAAGTGKTAMLLIHRSAEQVGV
ncbi:Electron transfer flavoprotein alpha-subunit, partial [Kappamyces sp. JEL0680]